MSYLSIGDDDLCALCETGITPAEVKALAPENRAAIVLKLTEIDIQRRQAFWTAVQGALTVAVPLALFLGLIRRRD